MSNLLSNLSASTLRQAADLRERIDGLEAQLSAILEGRAPGGAAEPAREATSVAPAKPKRTMSPAARARIAAGARARWAKVKAQSAAKSKRTMSPAAKARIATAMKARWARIKAAKKSKGAK
jgi:hypothetical protein